jgi:hypothetical protein
VELEVKLVACAASKPQRHPLFFCFLSFLRRASPLSRALCFAAPSLIQHATASDSSIFYRTPSFAPTLLFLFARPHLTDSIAQHFNFGKSNFTEVSVLSTLQKSPGFMARNPLHVLGRPGWERDSITWRQPAESPPPSAVAAHWKSLRKRDENVTKRLLNRYEIVTKSLRNRYEIVTKS